MKKKSLIRPKHSVEPDEEEEEEDNDLAAARE
jgi:hypothetical protein